MLTVRTATLTNARHKIKDEFVHIWDARWARLNEHINRARALAERINPAFSGGCSPAEVVRVITDAQMLAQMYRDQQSESDRRWVPIQSISYCGYYGEAAVLQAAIAVVRLHLEEWHYLGIAGVMRDAGVEPPQLPSFAASEPLDECFSRLRDTVIPYAAFLR